MFGMLPQDKGAAGFLAVIIIANIITQVILMFQKKEKVDDYNSKQKNEDEPKSLTYMNSANITNIIMLVIQGIIFCYLIFLIKINIIRFKKLELIEGTNKTYFFWEWSMFLFLFACLIMGCVQIWFMIDYRSIQNTTNSYEKSLTCEEGYDSSFYSNGEIAAISCLTIYFLFFVYILGKASCKNTINKFSSEG